MPVVCYLIFESGFVEKTLEKGRASNHLGMVWMLYNRIKSFHGCFCGKEPDILIEMPWNKACKRSAGEPKGFQICKMPDIASKHVVDFAEAGLSLCDFFDDMVSDLGWQAVHSCVPQNSML